MSFFGLVETVILAAHSVQFTTTIQRGIPVLKQKRSEVVWKQSLWTAHPEKTCVHDMFASVWCEWRSRY